MKSVNAKTKKRILQGTRVTVTVTLKSRVKSNTQKIRKKQYEWSTFARKCLPKCILKEIRHFLFFYDNKRLLSLGGNIVKYYGNLNRKSSYEI